MQMLIKYIDLINERFGQIAALCTSLLVILICWDVISRYFFKESQIWALELEWHLFSLIFLFGAAYAFKMDKHVRVDVFYHGFTPRKKAWVNILGTLFLLLPWTYVIIKTGVNYSVNSFLINEGSPNPGGLPARYLIKFSIVIGFVLLALQGLSQIIKDCQTLIKKD